MFDNENWIQRNWNKELIETVETENWIQRNWNVPLTSSEIGTQKNNPWEDFNSKMDKQGFKIVDLEKSGEIQAIMHKLK